MSAQASPIISSAVAFCPFCRKDAYTQVRRRGERRSNSHTFRVRCDRCGAWGPPAHSPDAAAMKWGDAK